MKHRRALDEYKRRKQIFDEEIAKQKKRSALISAARLLSFLFAASCMAQGFFEEMRWWYSAGAVGFLGFVSLVVIHWRVISLLDRAHIRQQIHQRHIQRLTHEWKDFQYHGEELLCSHHPYAADMDLFGVGSLFQRIDVSHTEKGEQALGNWLGKAAALDMITKRQRAVKELATEIDFRQELEAAALPAAENGRLDASRFQELLQVEPLFNPKRWLSLLIWLLPMVVFTLGILSVLEYLPETLWILALILNIVLLLLYQKKIKPTIDLVEARYGTVGAFEKMLLLVERGDFESELLIELREQLLIDNIPPSTHLSRLRFWIGLAELRQQFLFHVFINPVVLWDLHVLRGLENWVDKVGRQSHIWFEVLGEFEALSSLAAFAYGDPDTSFPEVAPTGPLQAERLAHPLLPPEVRVANDLLVHPGSVLIITGSNMAGKSTMLRTVGVNVALALAGGPICGRKMQLPLVQLHSSMRIEDSLQEGASYFHAELQRLSRLIQDVETSTSVLFLLDELLRGTNEKARQIGGMAILDHLLARNTMGLMATHHLAFVQIEDRYPGRVRNMHLTDTIVDGNMQFDYRLRPGVAKTSNALKLLKDIGIDISDTK